MQYTQATLGRIFVVRFEAEEDLLDGLKDLIRKEKVKSGIIHLIGALGKVDAVVGPEKNEYPPNPVWWNSTEPKEILGLGIFAWDGDDVKIHLHSGFGNKNETKIGCIRTKTEIYLTIEGVIQEFTDTNVVRKLDERYNASLLSFE